MERDIFTCTIATNTNYRQHLTSTVWVQRRQASRCKVLVVVQQIMRTALYRACIPVTPHLLSRYLEAQLVGQWCAISSYPQSYSSRHYRDRVPLFPISPQCLHDPSGFQSLGTAARLCVAQCAVTATETGLKISNSSYLSFYQFSPEMSKSFCLSPDINSCPDAARAILSGPCLAHPRPF